MMTAITEFTETTYSASGTSTSCRAPLFALSGSRTSYDFPANVVNTKHALSYGMICTTIVFADPIFISQRLSYQSVLG